MPSGLDMCGWNKLHTHAPDQCRVRKKARMIKEKPFFKLALFDFVSLWLLAEREMLYEPACVINVNDDELEGGFWP